MEDMEAIELRLEVTTEELRVADEELRAQQELIDGLLRGRAADQLAAVRLSAALPVPLVGTDRDGLVTQANPAAAALFHLEVGRLRGKPLAVLVETADRRVLRSALARALSGGTAEHLTIGITPRRDGVVPVDAVVLPEPGAGTAEGAWPAVAGTVPADSAPAARWVLVPRVDAAPAADVELLTALAGMSTLSAVDGDLRSVLTRLATFLLRAVPAAVGASVVVGSPASPTVLAGTDQLAQTLDGLQLRAAEGPSWDAYESGQPVATARLGTDDRWPVLGRAVPAGTGGAVAVPIVAGSRPLGVLTLYGTPALAEPGQARRALPFATAAVALLHENDTVTELRRQEAQLREALTSRAMIDQAKGILMARHGLDADAAFAELTRRSQHANVKLREVARQLVEEVSGSAATPSGSAATPSGSAATPSGSARPRSLRSVRPAPS